MRWKAFRVVALVGPLLLATAAHGAPAAGLVAGEKPGAPRGAAEAASPFTVPGEVALASLASLGDAHLTKLADSLAALAATPTARGGRWDDLHEPLAALRPANVDALLWFARPDGSYWSLAKGKEAGNLSTRSYFPRVLRGETVLGTLVVSKATGRSSAIVAVPVRGEGGQVTGVLGASVYLEAMSERLRKELALPEEFIFFSFDATPIVALNWDPHLVLADPAKLGPGVARAFREMLGREAGVVRYDFRGQARTVMYRRSTVTGWWYALGAVEGGKPVR